VQIAAANAADGLNLQQNTERLRQIGFGAA